MLEKLPQLDKGYCCSDIGFPFQVCTLRHTSYPYTHTAFNHIPPAAGQVHTARWLINSDVGGTLVVAKDKNGDTPAHDAADNG